MHALDQAGGSPAVVDRHHRFFDDLVHPVIVEPGQQFPALLRDDFAGDRKVARGFVIELFVIQHLFPHLADDLLVLAGQGLQVEQVLPRSLDPVVCGFTRFGEQRTDFARHRFAHDFFARGNDFARQHHFQALDAGTFEQIGIAANLADQRFLRGNGHDAGRRDVELGGGGLDLALDGAADFFRRLEVVPQHVDLVQHRIVLAGMARHPFVPDLEVGLGHPGIGRQQEEQGVRVGDRGNGQFRLDAHRIQTRGIENGEAGFEQRMRVIDHGVAPGRNLDAVLILHHVAEVGVVFIPQAERARFNFENHLGFRQLAHRGDHRAGVLDLQLDRAPFDWMPFQRGDAVVAEAGFDRQQADIRFSIDIVVDLCRTHRGTAGIRRQQALLEIGEEEGVDQLGFAATEFGDEGDHQSVMLQRFGQIKQAQQLFRLGNGVVFQPLFVSSDHLHQPVTPVLEPGDAAFQTVIHPIIPISRRSTSSA